MAEFRSSRERAIWVKLVQELEAIPIDVGGAETLRQKLALLSAAVGMLPYEPEVSAALRTAVARLTTQAQDARTYSNQKLGNDIRTLQREIIKVGERARQRADEGQTRGGRRVARAQGRDYDTFDWITYKKAAREQLLELLDQNKLGNPVGELKKLVVESLKALEEKDLARYQDLQESIKKLEEDDQVGTIAARIDELQELVVEDERKRRERRKTFMDNMSERIMDQLEKVGYRGLNVANTLRAGTALSRVGGRALAGGFNLATEGVKAIIDDRRIRAAVAQVQNTQAEDHSDEVLSRLDSLKEQWEEARKNDDPDKILRKIDQVQEHWDEARKEQVDSRQILQRIDQFQARLDEVRKSSDDPETLARLDELQKQWEQLRDADCEPEELGKQLQLFQEEWRDSNLFDQDRLEEEADLRREEERVEETKERERKSRGRLFARQIDFVRGLVQSSNDLIQGLVLEMERMEARFQPQDDDEKEGRTEIEKVEEERKHDQRRTFLRLFSRQVDLIKGLTQTSEERQGTSFLGRFASMLGALLSASGVKGVLTTGGALTWGLLKKGLLGLGIAASGVVGKIGGALFSLFGIAAKAGGGVLARLGMLAARFLPFFLKRALVFIPVVGVILAGILFGKDIYDAVQKFVMPYLQPMIDRMAEWLTEAWTWTKNKFTETVEKVKKFVEPVQNVIKGVIETIGGFLSKPLEYIKDMFDWLVEKAKGNPIFERAFKLLRKGLSLANPVSNAADAIMNLPSSFSTAVGTVTDTASNLLTQGAEASKGALAAVGNASSRAMQYTGDMMQSSYSGMSSALGRLFTKKSDVHLDGVHPALQDNFMGMVEEYRARGGTKPVIITSAYRSYKEQADLYKKYGPGRAAPPGRSLHEFGLAIDADRGAMNEMDKMGLIKKYGLTRPFSSEPWHVQPQGVTLQAAKEGVYSSDAANHQGGVGLNPAASVSAAQEPVPDVTAVEARPAQRQRQGAPFKPTRSGESGAAPVNPDTVPQFSYNDGAFFATNLGMFAR